MKMKTGNYATQYQLMVSLMSANFLLHKCILISLFDVQKIRYKFAIKIAKLLEHAICLVVLFFCHFIVLLLFFELNKRRWRCRLYYVNKKHNTKELPRYL